MSWRYVCNTLEFKFHNASWKSIEFFTFWRGSIWKYTSCSLLLTRIWKSVYGLSPFLQWFSNHITHSSLSLYERITVFISTQEKSNKLRVFEYSIFLQQLWCINLGNSFGNTWYRSNISCFVLVFKMITVLITIC